MRIVAEERTLERVVAGGGDLYVWPRGYRCCAGRSYVLEASTDRPDGEFSRVLEQDGVAVWATPGLAEPDELHLDLGRRGTVKAYWNGQSWIG